VLCWFSLHRTQPETVAAAIKRSIADVTVSMEIAWVSYLAN